eukprot:TRINITY_DN958_c0_g1_i1.p1 TRINITY_DN958_c0_g1~~TRINITY_DN958_c0_g1_i1.p1  ORF type:complete len:460 (+),score=59.18 TRINITY_DN958_c0_g1_i1:162-1382(+)
MAQVQRHALVVGNGIIGLSTAICLQRQKFSVVIVTSEKRSWREWLEKNELSQNPSPSAVAGGWWFPFHAEPADKVEGWGLRTLEILRKQMTDETSAYKHVLEESPSVVAESPETPLPKWTRSEAHQTLHSFTATTGAAAARELETHFGSEAGLHELPDAFGECTWFMKSVVADSPRYAALLEEEFRANGGEICYNETLDSHASVVTRAEEVNAVCVVNCAGTVAAKLSGSDAEDSVVPGRGILSVWRRPKSVDGSSYLPECSIIKFLFDGKTADGKYEMNRTDMAYVIPRGGIVACGGCVRLNDHTAVSDTEKDRLLSNAKTLMPALVEANPDGPLFSIASWRPIRPKGIACEVDDAFAAEGCTKFWANNYGHGGAGWTLFWACAEELSEALARRVDAALPQSSAL